MNKKCDPKSKEKYYKYGAPRWPVHNLLLSAFSENKTCEIVACIKAVTCGKQQKVAKIKAVKWFCKNWLSGQSEHFGHFTDLLKSRNEITNGI